MPTGLDTLRTSIQRLHGIVEVLDDDAITSSAYPTEWTIAQVMSHLGSGAVIAKRGLEDRLANLDTPDDFAHSTWDEWNAKSPRSQVDDALETDAAYLAAIDDVSDELLGGLAFQVGPMNVDFDGFIGLRLNEHALHTWDIEVVLDPAATVPSVVAGAVVDNLQLIAAFTSQPSGEPVTLTLQTTEPERGFTLELTDEGAALRPATPSAEDTDLRLPAEAFARLVYGRLDPAHTPPFDGDPSLVDRLRTTFPGF